MKINLKPFILGAIGIGIFAIILLILDFIKYYSVRTTPFVVLMIFMILSAAFAIYVLLGILKDEDIYK